VTWVVGLVWGIAALVGVVVLGLAAFDLAGKAKRLRSDAGSLLTLRSRLADLQAQAADARQRVPGRPDR
jgi:hypothetical protein